MVGAKIAIPHFDASDMIDNPKILIIGGPRSGKSIIVRDLMYHFRHLNVGLVISPTDEFIPFYKNFFPDLFIHCHIETVKLRKTIERQIIMQDKKRKDPEIDPSAIIVFDDCHIKKDIEHDTMSEILSGDYDLTIIVAVQTLSNISDDLYEKFDYVFLLRTDVQTDREKICERCADEDASFEIFEKIFDEHTKNYMAMVIHRGSIDCGNIATDKIFWFQAQKQNEDFSFGSEIFQNVSRSNNIRSNYASSNNASSNYASSNNASSNYASSNYANSNNASSNNASSNNASSNYASSNNPRCNNARRNYASCSN